MRASIHRILLLALLAVAPAFADKGVDCTLRNVELVYPTDNATWYVTGTFGSVDIPLVANTDCQEETDTVVFQLTEEGDAEPVNIGADPSPPYEEDILNLRGSSLDQTLKVTLVAEPRDTNDDDIEATFDIRLVSDGSAVDTDDNGLPDFPFESLDQQGDRWYAGLTLTGETFQLLQTVTAMYGEDFLAKQVDVRLEEVSIELESNENAGQTVTVTASTDLLDDDEQGMLLVGMAPTLPSLLGSALADDLSREPVGDFGGEGQYIVIALIVSSDGGDRWRLVSDSVIAENPFTVSFEALPLATTGEYVLAYHRIDVEEGDNGLAFADTSGTWTSLAAQSVNVGADTMSGLVTTHSVVAPYFIVDDGGEGEGEGEGGGEGEGMEEGEGEGEGGDSGGPVLQLPTFFWIEALIGLAFGILTLVDGGVGGGSPCFIATAAYGTPMADDINVLRLVRDEYLLQSGAGTAFVDLYYRLSPPIADVVASHPVLAALVRVMLLPVIFLSRVALSAPWLFLTLAPMALWLLVRRRRTMRR